MSDLPALPRSELEIARIVWDLKKATVRQVMEALPPERELDFFTVQTYLRRLAEKGYLSAKREGRANVYVPLVKPDRVIRHVVKDFLNQLFDGNALPLMQHLLHQEKLTTEQVDSLQQELDSLRKKGAK
ncbi:MAG: BlaI/MecI/CopY family transcriptional regulator [Planctomycetaceae bacterium]|nr:BlaI/MecI/CopY family transcriptional regulator [Planctomycetaceae bacterium]MCA9065921.1 BlaI/MecI/CopY family transcriptional regulator [Planctomycetaceae bacterium]